MIPAGDVFLWMPVGLWLGADDEPISGNGVEPDVEVESGGVDEEEDPVLDRALELFAEQLENAA